MARRNSSTECVKTVSDNYSNILTAVGNGLLLVLSVYLIVCAIVLERRETRNGDKRRKTRIGWTMRCLLIVAEASLIVHVLLSMFEIVYGSGSDLLCEMVKKSEFLVYAIAIASVFSVLWLRQRVFYDSKALRSITSPFLRRFSFSIIIVMTFGVVIGVMLIFTTRRYVSSAAGCVIYNNIAWIHLPEAFMLSCTGYFQITLFLLFAYPIARHRRDMKNSRIDSTKLLQLITRARAMTFISVVADAAVAAISYSLYCQVNSILIQGLYELLVLTYLLCVICSYPDWKFRLYPFSTLAGDEVDGLENDSFI